jgi:hypothetical protein
MVMKAMRVEFKASESAEKHGMDMEEMGESAYHYATGRESVYSMASVVKTESKGSRRVGVEPEEDKA